MWFSFGRKEGFPTIYEPNSTPVTVDVLESGFIAAFIILILAFYITLPSSQIVQSLRRYVRITVILVIGLLLLLGNFGQEWEVAHITSRTPYKAGSAAEINASLSIKLGLRSVNVTLKSTAKPKELQNEIINYNERFDWTWDQGRFGFGPYAGHLQQEFRAAQYRGLPTPILWIMDYFVIDGEGFRFGRYYRTAGWYCHVVMWCAFTCWLLALILFRSVILYAAYCLGLSGILQLIANLLWLVIRNPNPLVIPFQDATMKTSFGSTFWLTFSSGIICLLLASAAIIMDSQCNTSLYTFFDVDPLNSYEVAYRTKSEGLQLRRKKTNDIPLVDVNRGTEDTNEEYHQFWIRRKTTVGPPVLRNKKPHHLVNV